MDSSVENWINIYWFQIFALVALVGTISCEDKPTKKDKRGLLGLGYGGHIGSGGLALGGYGIGSSSLGECLML